ncbi:hypothetical protein LJR030_004098 [Rhizobium sp. LjRoot30]|uniref:hypothetical protein n=1 Tax=Rhizobium sp. LjRoot30 TaxID=3342320 RepID=UPI003ED17052
MRANGFETYSQLQDHLAELDDVTVTAAGERPELAKDCSHEDLRRQIAWLRHEVAEMRAELSAISEVKLVTPPADRSWSQIATTAVVTFVIGAIANRLRLGLAGAVAAPLVAAKIEKQIW